MRVIVNKLAVAFDLLSVENYSIIGVRGRKLREKERTVHHWWCDILTGVYEARSWRASPRDIVCAVKPVVLADVRASSNKRPPPRDRWHPYVIAKSMCPAAQILLQHKEASCLLESAFHVLCVTSSLGVYRLYSIVRFDIIIDIQGVMCAGGNVNAIIIQLWALWNIVYVLRSKLFRRKTYIAVGHAITFFFE